MATTTPNYGLRKPATTGGVAGLGDPVDAVADISNNMDTIDTQMKAISDRVTVMAHLNVYDAVSGDVTSTSYVDTRSAGTNPVGFSFVCPPSGKVTIAHSCGLLHGSSATAFMLANITVRTGSIVGSGTIVFNPSGDQKAVQHAGQQEQKAGAIHTYSGAGFNPGSTYNVCMSWRCQSGTMTITAPEIVLMPSPT